MGIGGYCETTGPVSYHVQTDSHGLLQKHVDQIQTRMEPDTVSNSYNMEKVQCHLFSKQKRFNNAIGKWHCERKIILSQLSL